MILGGEGDCVFLRRMSIEFISLFEVFDTIELSFNSNEFGRVL